MFSEPEAIRDIFTASPEDMYAGEPTAPFLEPFLGPSSLLLLDSRQHLRVRRLMLPAFHGARMEGFRQLMAEVATRDIAGWPLGKPFALRDRMQAITFEVIMLAVFGDGETQDGERLRAAMAQILAFAKRPLVMVPAFRRNLGPLTPWRRFVRVRAAVDQVILETIRKRRADPGVADRSDLLSMLILASHEDGSKLDDRELRDQLVTILLAGHETTATSLAWTLDLLLHHLAVMNRLQGELESGGEENLEAVIKESLRLRPVIPEVGAGIFLTHPRADLYPEPREFRPERFLGTATDIYSWLPFGGGTRRCLGAAFAMMEMRVVLRCVLTATRLRSTSPLPERATRRAVTLAPRLGARVILDSRLAGDD